MAPAKDLFSRELGALARNEQWTDYSVASDVLLSGGPVTVMGRIDSADVFADQKARWPSGYVFTLNPDGQWKLISARYKIPVHILAAGRVKLSANRWHRVVMDFHGSRVSVKLDGHPIASVVDNSHKQGMIGIGTGWNRAQFDNLVVSKSD